MTGNFFNFKIVIFLSFLCFGEFLEIFVKPPNVSYKIQLLCPINEFEMGNFGTKMQRANEQKVVFDKSIALSLLFCFEEKVFVHIFKSVAIRTEPNSSNVPLNFQSVKKFEIRSSEAAQINALIFDVSDGPKLRISLGESAAPFYFTVIIKCEKIREENSSGTKIAIFGTAISAKSEIEGINIGNLDELNKCKDQKVQIEASKGDEWRTTTMATSAFSEKLGGQHLEMNFGGDMVSILCDDADDNCRT